MADMILSPDARPLMLGTLPISPIAWGMWRLASPDGHDDIGAVIARIEAALEAGITLFDTADIYGAGEPIGFGGAEVLLGKALAARPDLRARMVIATKGGIWPGKPYDSSPAYLDAALDASLARLGVERVELYQIHRRDFLTHPRDVAAALAAMVDSGKVAHIGVSNYSPAEVDALQAFLPFPLVSTQPEFSALRYQPLYDGTLDQAMARGMAVLAWSPLGGGALVGGDHPAAALLAAQGARYGVDAAAAALSWMMVHPARIVPIVGSQSPLRILAARDAYAVQWTSGEWYAVLAAARGERLP
ncbi:aldo/keto reductase [Novosphingobium sp. FSY-8]|uniref:Aldo/keto reductase n=1 Tax=Novosphingobium ovatum TaxID=1908523 RepID=A0ABW9XA92_9SPHN|nr:aldo/keto reductase [Novosphingobium ovatum]NBC35441.1 aldo/keto reductase [Novosphingobium ovatum]